jgi:sulfite exporter TauE/SafE
MKEDLEKIYGSEWRWLKSLTRGQKVKVIWFALSIGIALGICDGSNIYAMIVAAVNFCAAAHNLKGLSLNNIKE